MAVMIIDNLTESQKRAVEHKDGPLLVLAGPGSGKTRVITHRIARLIEKGVRPWNICAITFTNRAAEEMRQRVAAMGVAEGTHLSTFHSLCVRILRRYAMQSGITSNFSIYSDDDQKRCMKEALKACDLSASNFTPARMLESISNLKNELETAKAFKENRADDYYSKAVAKVYEKYQTILEQNNALDFDDLLMKVAFLLKDEKVRSELNNRFRYILVDEYQDTNHAQYQIARGLAMGHNNICVTGDPDQSIYRWRGADIRNIMEFERDWPDAVVVKLEENFRSCASILKAADKLIAKNKNRKAKVLIPTINGGDDINYNAYDDGMEEAYGLAENIKKLTDDGVCPGEIAVFYRINSMSRIIEEALVQNKVPYQIVRGVEFYNRKEIRDILAYMKILVNPADNVALLRIINTPARGIGKTSMDRVIDWAGKNNLSVYDALKNAGRIDSINAGAKAKIAKFVAMIEGFKKGIDGSVGPLMEKVFNESGLMDSLSNEKNKSEAAIDNVNELINAAEMYDEQVDEPSLVDYLQTIALYSDADAYDSDQPKVALMTLHAAKGLEFDNVFIIGLEDGILPHERSTYSEEELEEERRLFFVGITRARKRLFVSYASHRTIRGQFLRSVPSEFLTEIDADVSETQEAQESFRDLSYDDTDSQLEVFDRSVKKSTKSDGPSEQYKTGQLVKHSKFGLGRVKQFIKMGDNSIVVVHFNTGQTRSLMLKYAKLEICP